MRVLTHHTDRTVEAPLALVEDTWTMEVVPRLPADRAAEARRHKAFPRVRGLATPVELLRAVLASGLGTLSTRRLGAWAVLLGLAAISEAAWRQRLRACHPWWLWLLSALVATPRAVDPPPSSPRSRVRLVDASTLRPPGGTGDAWRLHVAYDFTAGRLEQVRVTDRYGGERLVPLALQPGDMAVADTGYGSRTSVASATRQPADVGRRVTPATCPLETAAGEVFAVVPWRRTPSATALRRADWVRRVTTLAATAWPLVDVRRLDRARWQVELVLKRMKQWLRLHQLRSQHPTSVEATVRAWLMAWALPEEAMATIRAHLPTDTPMAPKPVSRGLLTG